MSDAAFDLRGVGVMRSGRWLLRGVTWSVPVNQTVALLGANGSGKSTLMKVICGYTYPTEGSATVVGHTFGQSPMIEMRRRVRLVAAQSYGGADEWANGYDADPRMTVRDVVLTGLDGTLRFDRLPTPDEHERATAAMADAGIEGFAHRLYGTLSTGERTRVQLSRALITRPSLLLLDEPALGLDLPGRESLLATLESLHGRTTIVLVTHHPEDLPTTVSQAMLLRDGHVCACGNATDVLTSTCLTEAYGVPLHVVRDGGRFWVKIDQTGRHMPTAPRRDH